MLLFPYKRGKSLSIFPIVCRMTPCLAISRKIGWAVPRKPRQIHELEPASKTKAFHLVNKVELFIVFSLFYSWEQGNLYSMKLSIASFNDFPAFSKNITTHSLCGRIFWARYWRIYRWTIKHNNNSNENSNS